MATASELYFGTVTRLASLFYPDIASLGSFESIPVEQLPDAPKKLLAHNNHMTVTLEQFHATKVDVSVLQTVVDSDSYARTSLLTRQSDGAPVQFGVVRFWTSHIPEGVRNELTRGETPLGRVLVGRQVLREVQWLAAWKIVPGRELRQHLNLPDANPIFGRTAEILVDQRPTIQMLEIVQPDPIVEES